MENISAPYIQTPFMEIPVYTFSMKVKDLVYISYVAVRGIDKEEGAVQRILNRRRISAIKDFVLKGNMFFNTFILNWTEENVKPVFSKNQIQLPISQAAAQLIDGQHRLAGLHDAMESKDGIGEEEVLISLCIGLTTKQAAKIFLNINSEQRPVAKSLIYDLFGEVEDNSDHTINRANDIAQELNENIESPYYRG